MLPLFSRRDPDRARRRRALAAMKVVVREAARYIGEQVVQLYGGMGMTAELKVS